MKNINVIIAGTGSYLPEKVLTNKDLEKMVDTTDEWIVTRTGIKERRIAGNNQATSDMAIEASKNALASAKVDAADIELIIVATVTPDMFFPSTACIVQNSIGAKNAICFDISAACSGFIYGLEVARAFIESGRVNNALVIGAEKLSSITDWTDRSTCVLFGDGAGAVVLKQSEDKGGLLNSFLASDGALGELLCVPAGGSKMPVCKEVIEQRLNFIKMKGNEVFKYAVKYMSEAVLKVVDEAGISIDEVTWIVPHQANTRIISAIASRLGLNMDKFYLNLEKTGNLSGASIPVALDEAVRNGKIKKGDKIILVAFGAGFTWGAIYLVW